MPTPDSTSTHPLPHAPAPWHTKSECYWLFLTLKSLPKGLYDPLESSSADLVDEKKAGQFKGGLGCIIIVRYRDTPVGPYDELILIPGNFTIPQPTAGVTSLPKIPKKALRIARIYVSQRTTVYNGRVNWNIPKHLARFEFDAPPTATGSTPPRLLTVKVYPAGSTDGDGVVPFFACTLKPWTWVPSLPVSTRWMPLSTAMAQPPLPAALGYAEAVSDERDAPGKIDAYDINPKLETSLLAGTDRWCVMPINSYTPRARGCWVTVHPSTKQVEGEDSGVDASKDAARFWPQDVQPWSVGAWMEDAEMDIEKPIEWKL